MQLIEGFNEQGKRTFLSEYSDDVDLTELRVALEKTGHTVKVCKPMLSVILGAEGCAELKDESWIRDATSDEIAAFKTHHDLTDDQLRELLLDSTGRPYWIKTLTPGAPVWALAAANKYGRVRYLTDYKQ